MIHSPTSYPAVLVSILAILTPVRHSAAQARGPVKVSVCRVVERDVPASIRLVGTILADKSSVIASQVSGPIAEFAAEEGQFLKQGEPICRIDARVSKMRYDEAAARLNSFLQKVAELESGTRPEDIKRLKASVDEAQALYDKADFEKKRVDGLFKLGQSNEREKKITDSDFIAAARRLTQANARLELAQNGPRAEVIAQARYDAAAQKAIADRLERDWNETTITAPFDGFVVAKRTEVGEWLVAGGPIAEMVAIEKVKVRIGVPEIAIQFARAGQPASVEIKALGKTLQAAITRVIPKADGTARTFPVEIDLPNADHTLLPGMFVWARVPSGPPGKRLMISRDAIVARGPSKTIFVVRAGKDGPPMAIPTQVTTGMELGDQVEIDADGIHAGDMIVCRGNERLRGPTPVIATEQSAPAGVSRR